MSGVEVLAPEYRPLPEFGGFFEAIGQIYILTEPGDARMAFEVQERHLNPARVCHGGALASFADMQAFASQWLAGITDRYTPTINLTVDYIGPAPLGWLELRVVMAKRTSRLLFSAAEIAVVGGDLVARTNGVFSVPRQPDADVATLAALFH
ncbi:MULTISPECIES: PaaI family thioesterase [unclassified Sphingomonas]|uniref:PaaI family thioesterase n=1 Tax=unclassified Sphingomonas TaxID=196159 RepID=UPI000837963E|nr:MULTISPECIES: PaaI family thioesterase [unclassified Sphingomonas]